MKPPHNAFEIVCLFFVLGQRPCFFGDEKCDRCFSCFLCCVVVFFVFSESPQNFSLLRVMSVTSLLLWLLPMIVVVLRQWSGEWYTAIKDANYLVGKKLVNTSPVTVSA